MYDPLWKTMQPTCSPTARGYQQRKAASGSECCPSGYLVERRCERISPSIKIRHSRQSTIDAHVSCTIVMRAHVESDRDSTYAHTHLESIVHMPSGSNACVTQCSHWRTGTTYNNKHTCIHLCLYICMLLAAIWLVSYRFSHPPSSEARGCGLWRPHFWVFVTHA